MEEDVNFIVAWIKKLWDKYNRQVLTFIQTTLVIGAVAALDSLSGILNSGVWPEGGFVGVLVVLGTTALSAITQFIRGKLPVITEKKKD